MGVVAYIDVRDVAELRASSSAAPLSVGGNVTLSEAMRLLSEASKLPGHAYLADLERHIDKIANVPVRNVGTLAGNLSLKKQHPEFASDLFTILETVGARLNISEFYGLYYSVIVNHL